MIRQAEEKTDVVVEPIAEATEEDNPWRAGPPKATLARRAQSYSDFYDVVTAYASKEEGNGLERQRSLDSQRQRRRPEKNGLVFEHENSDIEDRLLEESHAGYETYLEQLQLSESHLGSLLSSTSATLDVLSSLSASFESVEAQTEAFRKQCESLVSEQRRLTGLADALEENARYYTYLEPMTRRLNAPGAANLVQGKDFPEMLSNLDNCLVYMESHPKQLESATYRSKYRLLLTRGLTLIRHHFTRCLGDIANDIGKRIQGGQLKETTHSALLYAKFRVPAPELRALGVEIQKRAVPTPDDVDAGREPEYASLMRELYQSYSATRGRLILPLVTRKMAEIASTPQQSDVLAFSKSAIGFMRGICLDEHELWFEWFETDGALYDFLESLMEPMYDYLRPRTIHETKLEKLCDLCATIQGRYMDVDAEDDESDAASEATSPMGNGRPIPTRKLDFPSLVQPALEDAQTRLVFLALAVLRDGIEYYKPQPADLEWPKRITANGTKNGPVLSGKRDPAPPATSGPKTPVIGEDESSDAESMFSRGFDTQKNDRSRGQEWYPTLPKAIWLLRRIYRLVNSSVFDDLAHRIVHSTTESLVSASQQISIKASSPANGQLFLLTHLLHLKQQIVAFDIEFVPPEIEFDFSSVTNTFYELRDRGALWNPASWYRLASGAVSGGLLPKVVENMLDAKSELDGRLRTVINDFVNNYSSHILAPISSQAIADGKKPNAKEPFDALRAVQTVRGLAEKDAPVLRAKLDEFLGSDVRTKETLVMAVRDQVTLGYEEFFDSWSEQHGGRKVSRKGKGREGDILGPEVFGEIVERVFAVDQEDMEGGM